MVFKKTFLFSAFALVSMIALLYGLNPSWFAKTLLGGADVNINFEHILRAVMCLYLAFAVFWLFCALTGRHIDLAILTIAVFAGGLFIGRLLSFALDGMPSPLLIFYAALEVVIVPVSVWLYRLPD